MACLGEFDDRRCRGFVPWFSASALFLQTPGIGLCLQSVGSFFQVFVCVRFDGLSSVALPWSMCKYVLCALWRLGNVGAECLVYERLLAEGGARSTGVKHRGARLHQV